MLRENSRSSGWQARGLHRSRELWKMSEHLQLSMYHQGMQGWVGHHGSPEQIFLTLCSDPKHRHGSFSKKARCLAIFNVAVIVPRSRSELPSSWIF